MDFGHVALFGVSTGIQAFGGKLSGTVYEAMLRLGNQDVGVGLGLWSGDITIDDSDSLTGLMRSNNGVRFAIGLDVLRGRGYPVVVMSSFQGVLLYPAIETRTAVNGDGVLLGGTLAVTGGRLQFPNGLRVDVRLPCVSGMMAPISESDNTASAKLGYSIGLQAEVGYTKW
jgi:hypothetical protein